MSQSVRCNPYLTTTHPAKTASKAEATPGGTSSTAIGSRSQERKKFIEHNETQRTNRNDNNSNNNKKIDNNNNNNHNNTIRRILKASSRRRWGDCAVSSSTADLEASLEDLERSVGIKGTAIATSLNDSNKDNSLNIQEPPPAPYSAAARLRVPLQLQQEQQRHSLSELSQQQLQQRRASNPSHLPLFEVGSGGAGRLAPTPDLSEKAHLSH